MSARPSPRSLSAAVLILLLAGPVAAQEPHTGHGSQTPETPRGAAGTGSTGDHPDAQPSAPAPLPPFIPPLTDADRRAAFPEVDGHVLHGGSTQFFALVDGVEWTSTHESRRWAIDGTGWIGGDIDRLWFRLDAGGGREGGDATVQVFYGRAFARWWDVLAGVRQDLGEGPARTWAAVGLQGLAPYWFEVDLTAYVSGSGHVRARVGVEYELLFTNRLVLQPSLDAELASKADPEAGIEAGLADLGAGLRLRYELRREFAPYIGLTWHRRGGSAGPGGEGFERAGTAVVAGLRFWF